MAVGPTVEVLNDVAPGQRRVKWACRSARSSIAGTLVRRQHRLLLAGHLVRGGGLRPACDDRRRRLGIVQPRVSDLS